MIKVTKVSATIVIFYVLMYVQTWGDNHILFYGASLITGLSLVISWFRDKYINISYVPYGIWNNLIMVLYSIITGIFVAYNYSSLIDSCITYAAFSIIGIAICYVSSEEKSFEWLLNVLIVLSFVCAIYMLTRGSKWEGYGRTLSKYNNPHIFAAVMNMGIFAVEYKCRRHDTKESVISGMTILFFLYCIVESGSRKYLIASLIIICIWGLTQSVFRWKKNDSNQRILLIILIFIIIFLGIYFYRNVYSNSLTHARMIDSNDEGNVNRIRFFQKAIDILKEYPIVGGGFDQFQYWSGMGMYSHSTYAEAIADFGVLGCLLYFAPIICCSYRIMKHTIIDRTNYQNWLILAFCIMELFIGIGQIFFVAFQHYIIWAILFLYSDKIKTEEKKRIKEYKYIR